MKLLDRIKLLEARVSPTEETSRIDFSQLPDETLDRIIEVGYDTSKLEQVHRDALLAAMRY